MSTSSLDQLESQLEKLEASLTRKPLSKNSRRPGGEARFAADSPLEGDGFELPVPREKKSRNLGIPSEFN
jgi:hypothetical protein